MVKFWDKKHLEIFKTKWRGLFDIVIVSKHPQVEVIK
jgi:hypothetical protein